MKYFLSVLLCLLSFPVVFSENLTYYTPNELDEMFANDWNKPEYAIANTAENEDYLTVEEKKIFYYLNLARLNPQLFAKTYVEYFNVNQSTHQLPYAFYQRKKSLLKELEILQPMGILFPDKDLFETARCFAYEGGKAGIMGHNRDKTPCTYDYTSECCSYGDSMGLDIAVGLLIDAGMGNEDLGHRKICLSPQLGLLGASTQPHKTLVTNTVLNFGYRPGVDHEVTFANGKYIGKMLYNKPDGYGTYFWHNGDKYEGNFINGEQTGKGTFYWHTGDKYEGDFIKGDSHGKGTFWWSNGNKYEGDFVNDQQTGKGTFTWSNGDRYEGDFVNGQRTGKGIYYWHNGNRYEGDFQKGQMHGEGTLYQQDKIIYKGIFKNGSPQK